MAPQFCSSLTHHSEIDSSSELVKQQKHNSNLNIPESDTAKERNTKSFDWNGSWVWEISGALLSVICMALLIGFLKHVDGKIYQNWEYSISPNAVASVIVTIAKAAILIPVSSCLGQIKWNRPQSRSQPIYHLQVLDQASRGPWGAIEVIWRVKPGLATVGAMLTILAVAIDPFAQQILAFPSHRVQLHNETAYIQAAHGYSAAWSRLSSNTNPKYQGGTQQELSVSEVEPTMQLAMLNGLARTHRPLEPVCPTDDCEYPDFVTFGTCSTCEDVTAASTQTCKEVSPQSRYYQMKNWDVDPPLDCTYTSPTGFNLTPDIVSSGNDVTFFSIDRQPWTSIYTEVEDWIDGAPGPIVSFFSAKYNGTLIYTKENATVKEPKPTLTECSVYWCEREYTDNSITLSRRYGKATRMQYLYDIDPFGVEEQISKQLHRPSQLLAPFGKNKTLSKDSIYTIDTAALNNILITLQMFFNSTLLSTDDRSGFSGLQSALLLYNSRNLSQALESMDEAMTDNIRSASDNATQVAGRAYSEVTFIHVRWPWIIFPVAVVILSIILLGATAISSRRLKATLWKSSLLPLLTGTLATKSELGHAKGVDELVNLSKKVKVKMEDQNPPLFSEQ